MDKETCYVCEQGKLTPARWTGYFDIRGFGKLVVHNLECSKCDTCGADPVDEEQIRRNEARIEEAKQRRHKQIGHTRDCNPRYDS